MSDSTATTPAAKNPAAPIISVSGDGNSNVGWLAVCTAGDGDTLGTPGVGTFVTKDSAGTAKAPVLLLAGADSASTTETSRIHRPVRVHEGGPLYTLPGSSLSAANVYQVPFMAVGGELTAAAATANQTLTNTLASNFGYLTDLQFNLYVTSTNASTLSILDASGGTVRFLASFAASALGTTITEQVFNMHFTTPIRTNAAGAALFLSTTGSTTQWTVRCNGFFATA